MTRQPRVLVVDDDRRMVRTLVDVLHAGGLRGQGAFSAAEAMERLEAESFDVLLSDVKMPGRNGLELYHEVQSLHPTFPVILMTAYSSPSLIEQAREEGVLAVVPKPLDLNALLASLSSLRRTPIVCVVDDDPHFVRTLGDILRAREFTVVEFTDPHGASELGCSEDALVLLDLKLSQTGGLAVLRRIREEQPHVPVIIVTGYREEMAAAIESCMALGARACLYKPIEVDGLLRHVAAAWRDEMRRRIRKAGIPA